MTSRDFLLIRSEPISMGAEHEQVERSALGTVQLGACRTQVAAMLDFRKHQLGGGKWGPEVSDAIARERCIAAYRAWVPLERIKGQSETRRRGSIQRMAAFRADFHSRPTKRQEVRL